MDRTRRAAGQWQDHSVLARITLVCALVLLPARAARAVDPFEIQVYEGDINDPLQAGLELHTNFVAAGRAAEAFPGEAVPDGSLRVTLEPSFGVLRWWELGAYLQLATAPARSQAHWGGFKLRSKLVAPFRAGGLVTFGLNIEVGRGVAVLGSNEWDTEMRPIISLPLGRWFFAFNPILGWALSGERHAAPDFEPCGKLRYDTRHGFGLGLEYYAGLGRLSAIPGFGAQEHFLYLVGDLLDGPVELNVGLGRGLSDASDAWTIKAIVGRGF
jgi:hypothetical protein